MLIKESLTEETILTELGKRLAQQRIARGLTQAALATQAGVAKRTVERVEAGYSIQMVTALRLFRVLGLMERLEYVLPEASMSPMTLLQQKQTTKERQRVSSHRRAEPVKKWQWKDEG